MDTPIAPESVPSKNRLEQSSFIIFLITLILVPLAFLPIAYAPLDISKTVVIVFGVLISSILYSISAFKKRYPSIPKHPLIFIGCGLVISFIISTLSSADIMKSFFGQGFELGTSSLILIFFLAALVTICLTQKERDRVLYIYGGVILSFLVVALFHVIRFIAGPEFLSFGFFQSTTSTLIGTWNDVALLAGVVGIFSYISLQFITLKKLFKIPLLILLLISGVFLFIVNSSLVWSVVVLVLAGISCYQYFLSSTDGNQGVLGIIKRLPKLSILLLIIAFVCAWKGDILSTPLIKAIKAEHTEIILPWQLTLDIASETVKESPLFGAGPNRFGTQYLKYKPNGINSSEFWNVEFNSGSGLLPVSLVTQGLVGFLLWCSFIIILLRTGFRALKKAEDNFSRFFIGSTFFSALFLWIVSFAYIPSHAMMFLTFVMTGLFIASLHAENNISSINLDVADGSRSKKLIPLVLVILVIVCAVWLFAYVKKTAALGYFQGGINALSLPQNQGIDAAENNFKKALKWDKNDIYYQALSEVNILKITALSQQLQAQAQQGAKAPDEAAVAQIGKLVEEGIGYTRSAIAFDPTNYYNYVAEARISEVALSLQVQNSYENTLTAYANALKYNPYNPGLYLNIARIEASQNKLAEAKQYIGAALQLKQNYIEAIFLLSQIQVSQGQIKEAVTSVQVASQINPSDPLIFFQLGLLYYNDKNYQEAVTALSKAVELNSQYANARYFLGLSYARLGRTADAITQFEELTQTNPDSQEVMFILSNLQSGKSPFADAKPPIDSKPENRTNLPVREKSSDN